LSNNALYIFHFLNEYYVLYSSSLATAEHTKTLTRPNKYDGFIFELQHTNKLLNIPTALKIHSRGCAAGQDWTKHQINLTIAPNYDLKWPIQSVQRLSSGLSRSHSWC
jgi:hypothetical protein